MRVSDARKRLPKRSPGPMHCMDQHCIAEIVLQDSHGLHRIA